MAGGGRWCWLLSFPIVQRQLGGSMGHQAHQLGQRGQMGTAGQEPTARVGGLDGLLVGRS